ncbi:aminotransferase class III-fold pyridoxal phosphate-dependent enzyme [Phaeobacter sp.]|uniref:aminotransferase class III-fold pyridoxal phosphate-dependent enzyme n=1 Tax=Phaeobacter sp. TaxID=1902409 RepID=UPI0025DBDF3F|nr:aminotransferase class III-fold pyridoxal phosphate-dependent enzyme [Phaeobacter sp.]
MKAEFWGQFKKIYEDPAQPCVEVEMYSEDVVEDYDVLFPVNDIDMYQDIARRCPGPILELGAGTGRVLCELLRVGHEVTGLDLSASALNIARKRLADLPPQAQARAQLVEGDATAFDLGRTFGLITIPACSIVLFQDRAARLDMFRTIAAHLAPDGTFAFDFPLLDWNRQAEWDKQIVDFRFNRDGIDRHIRLGVRAATTRNSLEVNIHWIPPKTCAARPHMLERKTVLVIDVAEIEAELAEAGLAVTARRTQGVPGGGGRVRWMECGLARAADYPLWHPHMPVTATETGALSLERGQGAEVLDEQGNRYVDLASGLWSTPLGQGHAGVINAVNRQLQTLSYGTLFAGYSNQPAANLARKLVALAPTNLGCCYLTNSGSESVDLAIKIARRFHAAGERGPRADVGYLDQSYHGTFFGSMAVSGLHPSQAEAAPGLPGAVAIPSPIPRLAAKPNDTAAYEQACADVLEARITAPDSRIGAFILEPVMGSAGAIVPSQDYLSRISRICREHEVLLIVDEVATGFGRCGSWFVSPNLGLQPDILLLSKGISAGYLPLGAVLFSHEIGRRLRDAKLSLGHGSSHNGNPACCAAGLATIAALESEGLIDRAAACGRRLARRLDTWVGRAPVRRLHGMGLFQGLELEQQNGEDLSAVQVAQVQSVLRGLGVLTYAAPSGLVLLPPLNIPDALLDSAIDKIEAALTGISFADGTLHLRAAPTP